MVNETRWNDLGDDVHERERQRDKRFYRSHWHVLAGDPACERCEPAPTYGSGYFSEPAYECCCSEHHVRSNGRFSFGCCDYCGALVHDGDQQLSIAHDCRGPTRRWFSCHPAGERNVLASHAAGQRDRDGEPRRHLERHEYLWNDQSANRGVDQRKPTEQCGAGINDVGPNWYVGHGRRHYRFAKLYDRAD